MLNMAAVDTPTRLAASANVIKCFLPIQSLSNPAHRRPLCAEYPV
ncbi:hypothetical protein D1BOALGB6SA_2826 [Olavius sp. associated proteobacterium Delta 1]|nr:hypothetical protein D1BOALGB6SA_2826 [Olavius sp. associated proteobacterium Delta 1]